MIVIQYLLDEHVDPDLRTGLLRSWPGIVVWRVGEPGAPERSTSDPDILLWCEEHRFILVTNNRSTMPIHLTAHLADGRHVPGIFILGAKLSMGETIKDLGVVWAAGDPRDYVDIISYMPISFEQQH
jgi:hypothetical protein